MLVEREALHSDLRMNWAPTTMRANLQTLIGGNITILSELCEKTRNEAFAMMMQHAANAIISARYDANELMQGVTEVLAYGTAVWVEKI